MRREGRRNFVKAAGATIISSGSARGASSPSATTQPDQTMQKLGFVEYSFTDGFYKHAVFAKGTGPEVIVMHELPGFDESTVHFLNRLANAGFRVHAPHLFGPLLWTDTTFNYARLCISREFGYLKSNRSAPICDWLRALARTLSEQNSNARIGVIGMCLTGAFVIPMVIEPGVRAGVISQPAIPTSLRYVKFGTGEGEWMQEINVSDSDLQAATQRCARDGVPVLVQRFCNDRVSPHPRAERIKRAFDTDATLYEYDDPRVYEDPKKREFPHALLTLEYDNAPDFATNPTRVALVRVIAFLKENLAARSS